MGGANTELATILHSKALKGLRLGVAACLAVYIQTAAEFTCVYQLCVHALESNSLHPRNRKLVWWHVMIMQEPHLNRDFDTYSSTRNLCK